MTKKLLVLAIITIALFAGCKSKTDNAAGWVGTYRGSGTPFPMNQIIVSEVNSTTLKMAIQDSATVIVPYGTLQNVTVANATTATINETTTFVFSGDTSILVTGAANLSGNTLTINGTAKNNTSLVTYAWSFTGSK